MPWRHAEEERSYFFNLCMISCIDGHPTCQHCIEVKEHHLNMKLERQIKQTLTSGPIKCVPHKHVERIPELNRQYSSKLHTKLE